jgi:hypothetical protein
MNDNESSDDELTITWASDTANAYDYVSTSPYDVNMSTISDGGKLTYGKISPTNSIWTTNTSVGSSNWSMRDSNVTPSGQLNLTGNNADIVINGQSLNATLTAIQERMGILVPNADMEAEWDELRELAERYRELEKLCKEKSTVWNKLKKI